MVDLILFIFSFLKFIWFLKILFCLIFCLFFFCPPILKNYNLYTWLNYFGFVWFYLNLLFLLKFFLFYTNPLKSSQYCYMQFNWYYVFIGFNNFISSFIWFKFIFSSQNFDFSWLKLHPLQKFLFIKLGKYTHFFVWTVHSALNIEK